MKVLFLSQRVPWPPDRGDRITTFHYLRHWRERGAEVRVGCLAESAADEVAAGELQKTVHEVCAPRIDRRLRRVTSLVGLLRGQPLTLPFFLHRGLRATVRRWLATQAPDVIHVYSSSMAQYVLEHAACPRLMQFAELDSDKWRQYAEQARGPRRWIFAREAALLLAFEARVARAFDVSFVVSEVEKDLFTRRIPGVEPVVLPNGVDVEHFTSQGEAAREPHTVIFTGVMDYEPNVDGVLWFARECWPRIRARHARARFLVVGSQPAASVAALHGHDGIEVTGRVPATPPWFDRAALAIAPLRLARGVQNKVLEAMSMGLAVVCSPQAAQGLGGAPGGASGGATPGIVVAAGRDATAAAVLALLDDPRHSRALGAAAAAHVRAHFRWPHMFALLDRVVDRLVPRALSRSPA